jgi:putative alpha-1,2-mannosidase
MSAWYVFSAMGFYPVTPGTRDYVIGTPQFDRIIINLPNGKKFKVNAKRTAASDIYVQSASCGPNPDPNRSFITHDEILDGDELDIVLGPKPGDKFGRSEANRPHTCIADSLITIVK